MGGGCRECDMVEARVFNLGCCHLSCFYVKTESLTMGLEAHQLDGLATESQSTSSLPP